MVELRLEMALPLSVLGPLLYLDLFDMVLMLKLTIALF